MQNETEPIQSASLDFFVPITVAYVAVCIVWLIVKYLAQDRWSNENQPESNNRWLDFALIFVAVAGTFLIGTAYRNEWLIPRGQGRCSNIITAINLCLPYVPIFVVLAIRRQSLNTVWLSTRALSWKIGTGVLAAGVGTLVFLTLRNALVHLPEVVFEIGTVHSWVHAPAVFLEAVAVAFVFVRLRWVTGPIIAMAMPCLLFAAAHVPSGIQSGRSLTEIAAFFVFNTLLSALIFSVIVKSRDIVWIAIPHFVLDIAIGAFR